MNDRSFKRNNSDVKERLVAAAALLQRRNLVDNRDRAELSAAVAQTHASQLLESLRIIAACMLCYAHVPGGAGAAASSTLH